MKKFKLGNDVSIQQTTQQDWYLLKNKDVACAYLHFQSQYELENPGQLKGDTNIVEFIYYPFTDQSEEDFSSHPLRKIDLFSPEEDSIPSGESKRAATEELTDYSVYQAQHTTSKTWALAASQPVASKIGVAGQGFYCSDVSVDQVQSPDTAKYIDRHGKDVEPQYGYITYSAVTQQMIHPVERDSFDPSSFTIKEFHQQEIKNKEQVVKFKRSRGHCFKFMSETNNMDPEDRMRRFVANNTTMIEQGVYKQKVTYPTKNFRDSVSENHIVFSKERAAQLVPVTVNIKVDSLPKDLRNELQRRQTSHNRSVPLAFDTSRIKGTRKRTVNFFNGFKKAIKAALNADELTLIDVQNVSKVIQEYINDNQEKILLNNEKLMTVLKYMDHEHLLGFFKSTKLMTDRQINDLAIPFRKSIRRYQGTKKYTEVTKAMSQFLISFHEAKVNNTSLGSGVKANLLKAMAVHRNTRRVSKLARCLFMSRKTQSSKKLEEIVTKLENSVRSIQVEPDERNAEKPAPRF